MSDDRTAHAPHCTHPEMTTTRGHSVLISRCPSCGAIRTVRRNTPSTPERSDQ